MGWVKTDNIKGPKGDKGDDGQSIKGDKGDRGDKGDKGDRGDRGPAPSITWDGTTIIVDGTRGPDLGVTPSQVAQATTVYDTTMSDQPLSGGRALSVSEGGATYTVDLAGDTDLTLSSPRQGVTVALDVVTNGHVLKVKDGPTIITDGIYALLLSRGKWHGGAAGAAAATGATAASGTEIAHLDLSNVADGTDISAITLSNGGKFSGTSGTINTLGGALVGTTNSQAKFAVTTPKQRVTGGYSMAAKSGDYTDEEIWIGVVTGGNSVALRVFNTGAFSMYDGTNDNWKFTPTSNLPTAPLAGTVTATYDPSNSRIDFAINGTAVGTATADNYDTTRKAMGAALVWILGTAAPANTCKITSMKVEAIS